MDKAFGYAVLFLAGGLFVMGLDVAWRMAS